MPDSTNPTEKPPRDDDGMWCKECGGWVDFTDLGSVCYHEHRGLSEPWGIKGRRVEESDA